MRPLRRQTADQASPLLTPCVVYVKETAEAVPSPGCGLSRLVLSASPHSLPHPSTFLDLACSAISSDPPTTACQIKMIF